jgi:HAD superfamily hydrolase (TIGR01509 family)
MKTTPLPFSNLKNFIEERKFRGVFFDLDGTLVNSMPLHKELYRQALPFFGLTFSEEIWQTAGMSGSEKWLSHILTFNKVPAELWPEMMKKIIHKKFALFQEKKEELAVISPTSELLKTLFSAKKYTLACVTSAHKESAHVMLAATKLAPYFQFVITAADVLPEKTKPEPEPYLLALEKSHLMPEECIVIEDTEVGVQSAVRAGMLCYNFATAMLCTPAAESSDI